MCHLETCGTYKKAERDYEEFTYPPLISPTSSMPVNDDGQTNMASSSESSNKWLNNTNIQKFTDCISIRQIAEVKRCLARWVYADNIPFRVVESNFFKQFVTVLRPAFAHHISSRYELSTPLLNHTHYEEIKARVSSFTRDVEYMSLISDGWSNIRGDSVINFVLTTPQPVFYKSINASGDSDTGDISSHSLRNFIKRFYFQVNL